MNITKKRPAKNKKLSIPSGSLIILDDTVYRVVETKQRGLKTIADCIDALAQELSDAKYRLISNKRMAKKEGLPIKPIEVESQDTIYVKYERDDGHIDATVSEPYVWFKSWVERVGKIPVSEFVRELTRKYGMPYSRSNEFQHALARIYRGMLNDRRTEEEIMNANIKSRPVFLFDGKDEEGEKTSVVEAKVRKFIDDAFAWSLSGEERHIREFYRNSVVVELLGNEKNHKATN